MAQVSFTAGQKSNLSNVPIKEGQLLFTIDDKGIYLDQENERISFLENSSKEYLILIDQVTGVEYKVGMRNGSLITWCDLVDCTLATGPNKTEYNVGENFDPTGITIFAQYADNSRMPITNYTYDKTEPLTETDTNVKITCTINDTVYIFDIAITVS